MNANISGKNRAIILFAAIIVIIVIISTGVVSIAFNSMYILDGFIAMLLLALAVILPIRQKRFSLYSLILIICSVLLILSGAIDYAYHVVVSPLPVLNQIEFSKIMRPSQVSSGLSTLAAGMVCIMLSFFGFQKAKGLEKSKERLWNFFFWGWVILGVVNSKIGIDSIIKGLHKL